MKNNIKNIGEKVDSFIYKLCEIIL